MFFILIIGFTIAFLAPVLYRFFGDRTGAILSLLCLGMFIYFCFFLNPVATGHIFISHYQWVPRLAINLSFYLDGLALLFALLISGFGALIILYAGSYLKENPLLGRFYMYLLFFMMSMLGLVLSGNLISLFVFWELTGLSSYLLISFNNENLTARIAALQAMLVTGGGGLIMLAGFILLEQTSGTYDMAELISQRDRLVSSSFYTPIVLLILIGAFTKSAQFPFHFWLPNAMEAPTPVSAYLHSATMVKAGIYLVARLNPALGGTHLWQNLLIIVGSLTMVIAAIMAFKYTDLKKILAYTTISALGMIFLMLGIGTPAAVQAAVVFILAHALYKGSLFLMAGNLDHQAGSRDLAMVSGLKRVMPYTAVAAILACLSMSGVVPFIGFIGKELIYDAVLNTTLYTVSLLVAVVFSSVVFTAIAINIGYSVFWGAYKSPGSVTTEASFSMLLGPLLLSASGLLFGLFPQTLTQPLLNMSVIQIVKDVEVFTLSIWHGFNLVLLLSAITLIAGGGLYLFRDRIRTRNEQLYFLEKYGPEAFYNYGLDAFLRWSYQLTRLTQNGYLRFYFTTILWTFIGILLYVLTSRHLGLDLQNRLASSLDYSLYELFICCLVTVGMVLILMTKSRVTALATMGVVGYGLALIYIIYSAPDVAMTQFLIETLTVVLFVLVLHKLPYFEIFSGKAVRFAYLFLSIVFGGLMTYILLLITSYPMHSELKTFVGENSLPLGGGRNMVNVILVDFRALDTLGESIVLAIAAIGIFSLLKLKLVKEEGL